MTIVDLYGKALKVTDLKAAIKQADEFRHYSTDDESMKLFVLKQQMYWQDVYDKLIGIKSRRKMV